MKSLPIAPTYPYRRLGADLPWGDPTRAHGIGLEGMFWRFADPRTGRAAIVLCGACRGAAGPWALVAGAVTGKPAVHTITDGDALAVGGRAGEPAVFAGGALTAGSGRLRARLDGFSLDAGLEPVLPWPRTRPFGALGPAHLVPGLGQYWHPHLPAAKATGTLTAGGETWSLDGWDAYAEKNWGSRFAGDWWWGQAGGLGPDGDAAVSFAGGRIHGAAPTAVVVALPGDEPAVLRLGPPLAAVTTAVAPGRWRVRARGPLHRVEVEAEADPATAHDLPVPDPGARQVVVRSRQHLAGHLRLTVRRGRRVLLRGETDVAGLELGSAG